MTIRRLALLAPLPLLLLAGISHARAAEEVVRLPATTILPAMAGGDDTLADQQAIVLAPRREVAEANYTLPTDVAWPLAANDGFSLAVPLQMLFHQALQPAVRTGFSIAAAAPAGPAATPPADNGLQIQAKLGFSSSYLTSAVVAVSADLYGGDATTALPVPQVSPTDPYQMVNAFRTPDREVGLGLTYTVSRSTWLPDMRLSGSFALASYSTTQRPSEPLGVTSIQFPF